MRQICGPACQAWSFALIGSSGSLGCVVLCGKRHGQFHIIQRSAVLIQFSAGQGPPTRVEGALAGFVMIDGHPDPGPTGSRPPRSKGPAIGRSPVSYAPGRIGAYAAGAMRGESGASNIAGMKLPFPELTMPRPTSRQVLADAGLAVGLTVLSWLQLATPPFAGMDRFPGGMGGREFFMRGHPASLLAFAVVALAFLPLAGRRRFPLTVLVATGVATALYSFMLLPQSFALLALLIALYTVGTLYDRWRLVAITIAVGLLSLAVASPDWNSTVFFAEVARILAPIIVAAALGDAARNRRAFLEEAQQRVLAAEATREEETLLRLYE